MTLLALILATALQSAVPTPVEPLVSPAVQAVVREGFAPISAASLAKLEALSAANDASATELLGEIYNDGLGGVAADPAKACVYFERSASVRADSAHNLATCHFDGRGRPQDFVKARAYYVLGHKGGWPTSGCALGNLLVRGQGGAKDVAGGLALCKAGAEAGIADAQTDYAQYLLVGEVTPKDAVAARRWLSAAAGQDHANAAFLLGQVFWNGDGTPKDRSAAARWWTVAYKRGRSDAALLLGQEALSRAMIERNGEKLMNRETLPEVRRWYALAAERDPDPQRRKEAAELVKNLDEIAARPPTAN